MKLGDIFNIQNGIAAGDLDISSEKTNMHIPFLRPASTQQRTIAGFVNENDVGDENIYPVETLFVSTNGEGSHTYSYVSRFKFAANSDVSILIPKKEMPLEHKLFYAQCITANRWRFSYGRKPKGDRLKNINLPAIPKWLAKVNVSSLEADLLKTLNSTKCKAPENKPKSIGSSTTTIDDLFEVVYGTNLELVSLVKSRDGRGINFVSRTSKNNGVSAKVREIKDVHPIDGPVLTVAGGGSVLETFLQIEPFYSGRDLFYLKPRVTMTEEEMLFYATCIRSNKFRYSYGRQANKTLRNLAIPTMEAIPSWVYGSKGSMSIESKKLIAV